MPVSIRQIRVEGNIAFVPLTQGVEAIIDASDIEKVSQYLWHAFKHRQTFYARTKVLGSCGKKKTTYMHRMITQAADGVEIDHIDRNGLNNTRSNLRPATPAQNRVNSKLRATSISGVKGVSWLPKRKKWFAHIGMNGKTKSLGVFERKEDAIAAREAALKHFYGDFGAQQ
jgi:hypothetical protein